MDFFAPDNFLSAVMDRAAFWLATTPSEDQRPAFLAACAARLRDPRFFGTAKAPAQDQARLSLLLDAGFRPVDVSLSLARVVRTAGEIPPQAWPGLVRLARPEDEADVRRISATSLTTSRFHQDPAIGLDVAARIKAEWAGNYFCGKRGQTMAVAEKDGRVAGFLLFLYSGQSLIIDLLAVDAPFRRQGAAAAIIAFAEANLPGFTTLAVGTQAANTGSVRFYESLGLRYTGSSYVLHAHGG
ncbi:MAG: GNAT family N-acetyltransferase [Humidesulfovibrio sp.]|uniref:GNAT family N-acetyltransferase n=1 Tax=Humidesulfovibrio sp. TaxID=2910988 RepID=UPI0027FE8603|nr:GNAT family N-acetyltransferase [Humidesulfovibrio sp.]MDQ7834246.1 GNAT family N-acetyltransferase [Humidesulfovibrio sp.]